MITYCTVAEIFFFGKSISQCDEDRSGSYNIHRGKMGKKRLGALEKVDADLFVCQE
jgi:hypothetical protein